MLYSLLLALVGCSTELSDADVQVIFPSGDDDGPIISDALELSAVQLANGHFIVRTPISVPSGSTLAASPNTIIESQLVGTGPGGYRNSAFYAAASVGEYESTLLEAANYGDRTIATTLSPGVGSWLRLSNANTRLVAQVVQAKSVERNTVELDREIAYSGVFRAGSKVEEIIPPQNISLIGNGATITGTGDRAIELSATQNSLVEGWFVAGQFQSIAVSFHVGSANATIRAVTVDGGRTATAGVALESCVDCAIDGATVTRTQTGSSNPGVYVVDSVRAEVLAQVDDRGVGIQLASASTNDKTSAGSRQVRVSGTFSNSAHYGALVLTPEISFVGARFEKNPIGLNVDFGAESDRPSGGPLRLLDVTGFENLGPLLTVYNEQVIADGLLSLNDGVTLQQKAIEVKRGSAEIVVMNSSISLTRDEHWAGFYTIGSGPVELSNLRLEMPIHPATASAGIVIQGASAVGLADISIEGGRYGLFVYGNGAEVSDRGGLEISSEIPITVLRGSVLE